jgi:hypothetical protein
MYIKKTNPGVPIPATGMFHIRWDQLYYHTVGNNNIHLLTVLSLCLVEAGQSLGGRVSDLKGAPPMVSLQAAVPSYAT